MALPIWMSCNKPMKELTELMMPKEVPIALLGEMDFNSASEPIIGNGWEEYTNQFMKGFVLQAIVVAEGTFHQHVNTTLVKPLLREE